MEKEVDRKRKAIGRSQDIGNRIFELVQESGLSFSLLEDGRGRLGGLSGRVMVISYRETEVQGVPWEEAPATHQELAQTHFWLQNETVVHMSSGKVGRLEKLGLSFKVLSGFTSGVCNVFSIRRQGGGFLERILAVGPKEWLFIIAHDNSLTVKQGKLTQLRDAGITVKMGSTIQAV